MQKQLQGPVTHDVRVTRIKGKGFGVQVFVNGSLNQEALAQDRSMIGPTARSLLRMEDKCGNMSDFASNARHRPGRKDLQRSSKA